MSRKLFYLVARKNVRPLGCPVFYCRFRNQEGQLLAWRSTGETSETRAELWALSKPGEAKEQRETITLESSARSF
jgi:hypothetical protein